MTGDRGRGNQLGKTLDVLVWISERRRPFTYYELAADLEMHLRSAHRWMRVLETRGLVDRCGTQSREVNPGGRALYCACSALTELRRQIEEVG